jgi:hypothetical protein
MTTMQQVLAENSRELQIWKSGLPALPQAVVTCCGCQEKCLPDLRCSMELIQTPDQPNGYSQVNRQQLLLSYLSSCYNLLFNMLGSTCKLVCG